METPNEVAHRLEQTNIWRPLGFKRAPGDHYRVNIVSDELCDDILNYIKPTLARHQGCDLIDVFPGAGVWSRKLSDALQPRSHLMLEPELATYQPFLEPLLQRPGAELLPESGIVWEHLSKVLTPTRLPHQVERKYKPSETPQRNDALLVSLNLSMYPKRRFRTFESLAQLVLFQLISSIRRGSILQKYGLVRMLIWVSDPDKNMILPHSVSTRKRFAVEAELSTDWVCEVAGADVPDEYDTSLRIEMRRSPSLDAEVTWNVLQRMRQQGIVTPPGRASRLMRQLLESGSDFVPRGLEVPQPPRYLVDELAKLEADFERGLIEPASKERRRLAGLRTVLAQYWTRHRGVLQMLQEYDEVLRAYAEADGRRRRLVHAAKLGRAWDEMMRAANKEVRGRGLLHRDNMHVVRQDPPVLNWDRRYVDPLMVRPDEFFPNVPCALLDVQPKAAAAVLREMGPHSTRAGDMFDLILRIMTNGGLVPFREVVDTIWPGATDGVLRHCPSLMDPKVGGSPLPGWGELTTRTLNERQLVEFAEGWMKWPFRPEFVELVSRTMDINLVDAPEDEGGGANPATAV